ncbi:unnamed protein product [Didymodactylos carnosus]|uniref:Laminin subunit gamma-1 n=1 Tax=Didymodactylos carnosus TaxID=1234261 RepID=A0A8S2DIV0_9BILA|nr:unnamed protein product [Didymodactylos carnosus]CAF3750858.1 unnamed protein product [Didymodactylos carnosus]
MSLNNVTTPKLSTITTKKKQLIPPPIIIEEQTCYNKSSGTAIRCLPEFVNAAFRRKIKSTNTCGERWEVDPTIQGTEYCIQTGPPQGQLDNNQRYYSSTDKNCQICDSRDEKRAHPPELMTDFNQRGNITWWQSDTMLEGVNYPNTVNLTLNLGKTYDVTYIKLTFQSPKPESFIIYKRTYENGPWIPYQYYSASCMLTFGLPRKKYPDTDTEAICSEDFSDVTPLYGSEVAFGTLDWRPGATTFEMRSDLQQWVTAYEIRIQLVRMNTFGDEMFGQPYVLKTYFYAISDLAVGGRCHCNGHANKCSRNTDKNTGVHCDCEHNTVGRDCENCHPSYNDAPWQPADVHDAHACKSCVCNGFAQTCSFNLDLYERTGHGSVCIDCAGNRGGPNCESCKQGYFRLPDAEGDCLPCSCDVVGSETVQCAIDGQCRCKPGVVGDKCNQCAPYHYNFGPNGCSRCTCYEPGATQPLQCNPSSGQCTCKLFVEGQNCDRCRPGYYNLDQMNLDGCTKCFCYGHASTCQSAPNYYFQPIRSSFTEGSDGWRASDKSGVEVPVQSDGSNYIYVRALPSQDITFEAPSKYLGDRTLSYNQLLTFILILRAQPTLNRMYTHYDVSIESGDRTRVGVVIYGGIPQTIPSEEPLTFRYRLNEQSWTPSLSFIDFMRLLSNITSIKIHATFGIDHAVSFLGEVTLGHSQLSSGLFSVSNVESCTCPTGYYGERCEYCISGYRRNPSFGGLFAQCVPCQCYNHSTICDIETGKCQCQHHTTGDNCERCLPGFYGNPYRGTSEDCQRCPCPNGVSCTQLNPQHVVCLNCPAGYTGDRCEFCDDGYFGDPEGLITGVRRPCELCSCNGNIDSNIIGNCNTTSGHCLKCNQNTFGVYCEKCLPGYWGDALATVKCHPCNCHPRGTRRTSDVQYLTQCNLQNGQCQCKPNVIDRQCDKCEDGYWNLNSDSGCGPCKCDPIGAYNISCSVNSGQCFCKPGVTGQHCDRCLPYHYGFSPDGCKPCNCDQYGSLDVQCDSISGQCPCKENFMSLQCDQCDENKYRDGYECPACPPCYREVQKRTNYYRSDLNILKDALSTLNLSQTLQSLKEDKQLTSELDSLAKNLNNLKMDLQKNGLISRNISNYDQLDDELKNNATDLENRYRKLERQLPELIDKNSYIRDTILKANETFLKSTTHQLTRINSLLLGIDRVGRTTDSKHEAAINKTLVMQIKINDLTQRLKDLKKKHDDANNRSSTAENIFSTKLRITNEDAQNKLEYDIKQRLTTIEIRRQKLLDFANDISHRVQDIRTKTNEWKTNLTSWIISDSDLSLEAANQLRNRASQITQDLKDLEFDILNFSNKTFKLQETTRNFEYEVNQFQVMVNDISRDTQDLFAEVNQAEYEANRAVDNSKNIENEVRKIREDLQGFVQDKNSQSKNAETQYNRLQSIQDQIQNITGKYWELNDEHRTLNITVANALRELENVKALYTTLNIREQSDIINQAEIKFTPISKEMETLTDHSSTVLNSFKNIKDQADIHVKRIEIASAIGKNLTNDINSARDQVEKLMEQLKSLQSSLNYSTQINITSLDNAEIEFQQLNLDKIFNGIEQFYMGAIFVKNQTDKLIIEYDNLNRYVNNIDEIARNLPTGCFKNIPIEHNPLSRQT